MDASFTSLFKRGHYYRNATKAKRERKDSERFLVAALAFCLKHDPIFAREFLRVVCEFSKIRPKTPIQTELIIEPKRDGPDLIITEITHNLCAVIEAKVWAKLKDHQDFRCKSSFCGPHGYGNLITRSPHVPKGAKIVYVVLDSRPKRENTRIPLHGLQLHCRIAKWEDLACLSGSSPLLLDFRECLARFGVSVLALEATKHMKIDKNVVVGAKAWKVL
jgi:hypothetical protein